MQGGELPSGSGLVVWIHQHLIKLQYKPCPCYLFCLAQVEDGVDPLGGPGACGSSLHVQQDEQDVAALIWELRVPHTEEKGAFHLEVVQVILGAREWRGGHNLGWLWGGDRGSTRLGWGWRPAMMSKLGLEGCNLCCVRAHPRPGAYAMSRYLQRYDISTRRHSSGTRPCCMHE